MRALMQKQVYDYLHLPCLLCPVLTRDASASISIRVSMSQAYAWAWEAYALEQGRPWPTRWSEDDLARALLILYLNLVPRAKWEGIALETRLPLVYQSYQKSPKSINLDEILSLSVFLYLCTPFAYDKSRCHFVVYPHFSTVYCWSSSFAWWRRALLHAALRSITKWLLWGKWQTSPMLFIPQWIISFMICLLLNSWSMKQWRRQN